MKNNVEIDIKDIPIILRYITDTKWQKISSLLWNQGIAELGDKLVELGIQQQASFPDFEFPYVFKKVYVHEEQSEFSEHLLSELLEMISNKKQMQQNNHLSLEISAIVGKFGIDYLIKQYFSPFRLEGNALTDARDRINSALSVR